MSLRVFQAWRCGSVGFLLLGLLAWLAGSAGLASAGSAQTTFSGRGTVVQATVLGLDPIVLSNTGDLPSSGGAQEASLLQASVPGLLTAEVLHAAAVGQGKASRSEASVANVNLTVGGHGVSAGFLIARAAAVCKAGAATVSGSSELATLVIDGNTVTIATQPNQTVALLGVGGVEVGRVIINEQTSSASGGFGEITVNALHVVVDSLADVVISHAHADINCAGERAGSDFVTGGGWITGTPSGVLANFGVAGGIKQGNFWGHLNYIDHGAGLHMRGTGVTAYAASCDTTSRHIEGTAEINDQGGFAYKVDVADNGEPGRNDTFALTVTDSSGATVYGASGALVGGNIQLHTSCP